MPAVPSDLRGLVPRGALVYTYPVSETRTGDGCRLLVLAVVNGEILSIGRTVGELLGWSMYGVQVIVPVVREKAGLELVQLLGHKLHGHTGALRHESLGEEVR